MERDGGDGTQNSISGIGKRINRRSYLKATGAAVGSLALVSGEAAADSGFKRRGIRFKHRVNMVTDVGCDPHGNEPCDKKLREAAADHTLLEFPEGDYYFRDKTTVLGHTNLGLRGLGDRGSVRFVAPENINEKMIFIDSMGQGKYGLLFENIDIDLTAEGATPGLHLATGDDLEVHDVELIGQGINADSEPIKSGHSVDSTNHDVANGLIPIVYDPAGTGTVENFTAHNQGLMGAYTRVGVWIGISTKGTITLRNCDVQGFPNNGLYCARTNGVVQIEGGTFKNNDISQVRIGSEGSYVKDATIAADVQNGRSPNPQDTINTRGVRLESGGPGDSEYRGGSVENCDITIASTPGSPGGVVAARNHGNFTITDTRIRIDVDRVRGILAKVPSGGIYNAPKGSRAVTIKNTEITGSAKGNEAIRIVERDGSLIEDSCIHQSGHNRDGVRMIRSSGCAVRDSTIDVTGDPIAEQNAGVATSGNHTSGSCEPPVLPNTLSISGSGSYDITFNAAAAPKSNSDAITQRISGSTSGGTDTYRFAGYATAMDLDGNLTLRRNRTKIQPIDLYPSTVVIDGVGASRPLEYEFDVTTALERHTVNGARANSEDHIKGNTATGVVQGGRDAYTFAGDITFEVLNLGADAIVNGRKIDTGPPSIRQNGRLPNDPDGDGHYEDVNGDGTVNVVDVQALFANRNSDRVQKNRTAFDFTCTITPDNQCGDTVDVVDIQRLFAQIT